MFCTSLDVSQARGLASDSSPENNFCSIYMEFIKLFNIVTDVYIQGVLHLIINFIVKPICTHNKEVKMHIKPTKMSCLTAKNEVTHKYAISDGQRCQTYKYAS